MHWHERPSLGIVLKGVIRKRFRDASVAIRTNDAFTLPAGIHHTDDFGPGSRAVVIEIDPDHPLSAERLQVCGSLFDHWLTIKDPQLRWLGRRLASELRHPDGASILAADGLVGEILSVVTRAVSTPPARDDLPDWLITARAIAQNELNRRVSVTEIAREVGVHPAYLARRFRAEYGVTLGAFARNARLDWAATKLIETELPIAELAIQAGFSDQSHFTLAFRRYLNQTPAQYRECYR
jgi:AraC family transcriptional regulator